MCEWGIRARSQNWEQKHWTHWSWEQEHFVQKSCRSEKNTAATPSY
jgi:hypothetical protein